MIHQELCVAVWNVAHCLRNPESDVDVAILYWKHISELVRVSPHESLFREACRHRDLYYQSWEQFQWKDDGHACPSAHKLELLESIITCVENDEKK